MKQDELPLGEGMPPTFTRFVVMTRVACAGCGSTARVSRPERPSIFGVIPEGWSACWALENGDLALWCLQCKYEGRIDSPPEAWAA